MQWISRFGSKSLNCFNDTLLKCECTFAIMHGPTDKEMVLLKDWIQDLVAFVGGEEACEYGTKVMDDFKVATPEGEIEIQKDVRWKELLDLADIFAGN
jgi:hypothetical protein